MNFPAALNLKPFDAIRPSSTGVDLAKRSLDALTMGSAGRYLKAPKDQHAQLVDQTQTWVAQTFFGTLLKQMRDSPFKSELFSGGQGGQAFGGLYDQQMAERMARGAGSKLVNSIVRRIEANAAYGKQQKSVENTGRSDNRRTNEPSHGSTTRPPAAAQANAPATPAALRALRGRADDAPARRP
jgi:Rod binding domain-containing protein